MKARLFLRRVLRSNFASLFTSHDPITRDTKVARHLLPASIAVCLGNQNESSERRHLLWLEPAGRRKAISWQHCRPGNAFVRAQVIVPRGCKNTTADWIRWRRRNVLVLAECTGDRFFTMSIDYMHYWYANILVHCLLHMEIRCRPTDTKSELMWFKIGTSVKMTMRKQVYNGKY